MWIGTDYEKYAISALGYFYPELNDMIKGESPDYYNSTIGVEIRRAITEKGGEIDAFWRKNQNCRFQDLPPKQLKKLGFSNPPVPINSKGLFFSQRSLKNGSLLYYKQKDTENLILCAYMEKSITNQFTIDSIDQAVSEKLDKLNDHYHILNRNDLCIIVQEQLNYYVCQEEIIDDLICNTISSIQKVYGKQERSHFFDNIFLLFLDNLFCINSKTWDYKRNIITQEQIDIFTAQLKTPVE